MIDVAFTPAELRDADTAVVIDVLRATTTATQALSTGYRQVLMVDTIERAREMRGPGRLLAGERGCVIPPGFDLGNSPMEVTRRYADEIVLATTNGAPATVAAAQHATTVFLACLLNLDAVVATLRAGDRDTRVLLVCSGTDGAPALEDIYLAGRICASLDRPSSDAARASIAVAMRCRDALEALSSSANARVLEAVGSADDIRFCARESVLGTVPLVTEAEDGVATLIAAPCNFVAMQRSTSAAVAAE